MGNAWGKGAMNKSLIDSIYSETTDNFKVSVVCQPILANSEPVRSVFSFAYTITIENLGSEPAQLLERHWIIKSNEAQIAEVVGPGVVGEQPLIEPGGSFTYTSGAVIQDPMGSMEGSYTFRSNTGRFFDVSIPRFELMFPIIIH